MGSGEGKGKGVGLRRKSEVRRMVVGGHGQRRTMAGLRRFSSWSWCQDFCNTKLGSHISLWAPRSKLFLFLNKKKVKTTFLPTLGKLGICHAVCVDNVKNKY